MCKMPESAATKNVLVIGAGPAGLLACIFLLRRNDPTGQVPPKYRVTLIDPGEDYGKLDSDGLNRNRSWMIGLSCHGLSAIREIPGLYEDYIHGLGIELQKAFFGISKRIKFELDIKDFVEKDSAFTVDRNYICAALSRYLNENFKPNEEKNSTFTTHYHTRGLYVDGENRRVTARSKDPSIQGNGSQDLTLDYDILLGCDGIRSIVRNAFFTKHRDFEFSLQGTFATGKSVHVPLPDGVQDGTFMFLNECLPPFGSFVLPETGQKLNVALGRGLNKPCPPELLSEDPKVVAEYFRQHWTAFDMDYDEVGKQWVGQGWNSISQVHCNFYHSEELGALLLGDAAHATSPQIGQGMNTALADAASLNALLDAHQDDWKVVLPLFSKERVKEGNALTDLSFYTFSLSPSQQILLMLRQNVRRKMNDLFPSLVDPDPMREVSRGMKLSEAYHRMTKFGVIPLVRKTNDDIMRNHFEKVSGMVRADDARDRWAFVLRWGVPVVGAIAGGIYFANRG